MKKLLLIITMLLLLAQLAFASSFCAGYKEGYKAGFCYQKPSCLGPMVPMCPMPRLNENSFQDGYSRGFVDGMAASN